MMHAWGLHDHERYQRYVETYDKEVYLEGEECNTCLRVFGAMFHTPYEDVPLLVNSEHLIQREIAMWRLQIGV